MKTKKIKRLTISIPAELYEKIVELLGKKIQKQKKRLSISSIIAEALQKYIEENT